MPPWESLIVLLLVCGPLLIDSKRVMLMAHQLRRRSGPLGHFRSQEDYSFPKKSSFMSGGFRKYGGPSSFSKKALFLNKDAFPGGGDDFDHGYEEVNNVMIPHGPGISHAVTFGKGYIPYDNIKDDFSLSKSFSTKDLGLNRELNFAASSDVSRTRSSFPDSRSFLSDDKDSLESIEKRSDFEFKGKTSDRSKRLSTRLSDLDSLKGGIFESKSNFLPKSPILGKTSFSDSRTSLLDGLGTDIFDDISLDFPKTKSVFKKDVQDISQDFPLNGPSASLGDSKHGIILQDTLSLDDYHQKVQELTSSWPGAINFGSGNFEHGGSFSGDSSWLNAAQPGYAVKEEVGEEPHDFRNMPVQTAPLQQFSAIQFHEATPTYHDAFVQG